VDETYAIIPMAAKKYPGVDLAQLEADRSEVAQSTVA
jgi:hypothetical protein